MQSNQIVMFELEIRDEEQIEIDIFDKTYFNLGVKENLTFKLDPTVHGSISSQ